jgi:chromosome segregation ATPase
MNEAVKRLLQLFPDQVLGRMVDICSVKSKNHNTALAVLMGRHMDSVVVKTFSVAMECIELLKQEQRDPMEFIPLDTVQVRNRNGMHSSPWQQLFIFACCSLIA